MSPRWLLGVELRKVHGYGSAHPAKLGNLCSDWEDHAGLMDRLGVANPSKFDLLVPTQLAGCARWQRRSRSHGTAEGKLRLHRIFAVETCRPGSTRAQCPSASVNWHQFDQMLRRSRRSPRPSVIGDLYQWPAAILSPHRFRRDGLSLWCCPATPLSAQLPSTPSCCNFAKSRSYTPLLLHRFMSV